MKLTNLISVVMVLAIASPVFAGEKEDAAVGIECMPAKDFVKILSKMENLKPEKKDTVSMVPFMKFEVLDGGVLPERVFFRYEGQETPFHLAANGEVTDFPQIAKMPKKGEMCMQDKTRIGKSDDENGLELNIEMDIFYHNRSGRHSVAELEDGLKDGRSHIKKMVPGPLSFVIPKFKYLMLQSDNVDKIKVEAMRGGQVKKQIALEPFEDTYGFAMETVRRLGADSIKISGAEYRLAPTPTPEDMKEMSEDE